MITIFAKTSFVLRQNANIFAKFFGENILQIITSVPGHTALKLFFSRMRRRSAARRHLQQRPLARRGSGVHSARVARWFVFKPEIPIWVNFGMENVGIFYDHS
jgi:hypothetical protein